ncbi:choice-of-anchor M domain-containing protein [Arcanobacterium phocisimile]|uniref:Choice-of-anchor M domain-containing protein n=1 Tax=Arcanobacterium phocisimile TaxID=1302235 RepID=A0ABX7IHL5_9ACTO|nr:choice-of-anchor M domain-containing protein [Arcanobacterium phocisimile]QRV02623.1 choice-of-anchor M domain-containing protein [Arcanobacterium phocisimile]
MKRRFLTATATCAVMLSALTVPASATTAPDSTESDPALTQHVDANEQIATDGERVERSAGHIDLGPKLIDNQWSLMARDDTETTPVWRHVSDMIYRVPDEGILEVPEDATYSFINDDDRKVWVVPQQEIPGVVWLGWNTQDPAVTDSVNGTVTLTYGGHEGPGQFTVFVQAGNFGAPQVLWSSDKNERQPIDVELHSHTHANWVFTEPGIHHVTLTAAATLNDGTTVSDTQVLTFAVGTDTDASTAYDSAAKVNAQAAEETANTTPEQPASDTSATKPEKSSSSALPLVAGAGIGVIVLALVAFVVLKRREAATKKEARGGK